MKALACLLATYMLNAAWQVPFLLAAATLAARTLRGHRSLVVHRLWVGTLCAQVLLPAVSTEAQALQQLATRLFLSQRAASSANITVTFGSSTALNAFHLSPLLVTCLAAFLATCYAFGLVYAAAKLVFAFCRTLKFKSGAAELAPNHPHAGLWTRSWKRFGVSRARLLEAPQVRTPLTLGLFRPCVLVPSGFLAQTPATDLEALFAHECAHIVRHDFAWNVLFQVLALPLAFHPLLRRTQDQIAESREWVCDDLAVGTVGTAQTYAHSLLRLATQLLPAKPAFPNHAIGMLDANALERRLMHLMRRSKSESVLQRTAALAFCGLLGVLSCGSAWAWRTGVPTAALQQEPNAPVRISGGVMAGLVLTRVDPIYPPEAKAQGIEGSVVLSAVISDEGMVEQLTVVSGPEALRRAAIDSVHQWTYRPYELNGKPVAVSTVITLNFKLQP